MSKCPICSTEISESEMVCQSCQDKIRANEPVRKEDRIRSVANNLVIFLAVFFFVKGSYGLLGITSYKRFVEGMGFPVAMDSLHYWNASICILAALGYAVTALGNYLGSVWTGSVCRFSLAFFILGQLIIQIGDISEEFKLAEAIAVVCFLGFVPLLQYVMSQAGRKAQELP